MYYATFQMYPLAFGDRKIKYGIKAIDEANSWLNRTASKQLFVPMVRHMSLSEIIDYICYYFSNKT